MTLQKLIYLIYENDVKSLKKIKKKGVDFCMEDKYDKKNILIAYSGYGYNDKYSERELIDFLLDCGIDLNHQASKRDNELSALHYAVANDNLTIIEILVNKGANIEIKDSDGMSPLALAISDFRGEEKKLKIINFLIDKGASLNSKNNHGISIVDVITQTGEGIDQGLNDENWDLRFLIN